MEKHFFIFGFGYTAKFLVPKLLGQGFKVTATSRNPSQHHFNDDSHIQLINFNQKDQINASLNQSTHLLISVPPSNGNDPAIDCYAKELLSLKHPLKWTGYLSSTSVYGDHQGNWVDESSPTRPCTAHAIARLEAENAWKIITKHHSPIHIFRLAGIYGPYRNAITDIVKGKASSILKEGQAFSRIHVEDITKILLASIMKPNPGSIYNVADDLPAPSHEVDNFASQLMQRPQLPLIPFSQAKLSSMAQDFYKANRKVSNEKIKMEFEIALDYPRYQEGLTSLFSNKEY